MPLILSSLAFQTKTGFISRGCPGSAVWLACRAARHTIRTAGFTLAQAWAAHSGYWHADHLPPGFVSVEQLKAARQAWHQACRAAWKVYAQESKPGCPPALNLRLVLALQKAPNR